MKYQELLYSRSLSKDYRWMIVPPKISPDSLKLLNQLYNLYDKYKNAFCKSPILPLYCLNHLQTTFLVSCGLSNHKDKDGRNIYHLQGISISHEYRRHFWFILPCILANYDGENLLNTWRKVDFPAADDIVRRASEDCFFKLDLLDKSLAELIKTSKFTLERFEELSIREPIYIPFDKNGLKELAHVIVSSDYGCVNFAFGATSEMIRAFDFKIIAKLGDNSNMRLNRRTRITESIPSFILDEQDKDTRELVDDPIDRFDPRKKDNLNNQSKMLRRNNSFHIFDQFVPRFLSILRLGKKLKRSRKSG
ncbi:MAG: hypothetical protein NG784_11635 [Candidatus Jettenia sp.]|nr:hypothetical protein [Candidatus Jettenia sp.]